jgi:threonine/homoserine/homoserine lactone efflux protein
MIDPEFLLQYIGACLLFSIVPGPSVTVVVANSLARGTKAGLLTILGTEIAMLSMVLIVAIGMDAVMGLVSEAFTIIKLVGAAYLIWIGWKMFTATGKLEMDRAGDRLPLARYLWQGALINWSNPKTLLFLGAFLPQFVDTSRPAFEQIMTLGLIVMVVATATDSIYAVLAGRAREVLTSARVRVMSRVSGVILMIGGVWLALSGRAEAAGREEARPEHVEQQPGEHQQAAGNLQPGDRLAEQQRRATDARDRHQQRERRHQARRVARQQQAPGAVAEQRGAPGHEQQRAAPDPGDVREC